MRQIFVLLLMCVVADAAFAAPVGNLGRGRVSMSAQMMSKTRPMPISVAPSEQGQISTTVADVPVVDIDSSDAVVAEPVMALPPEDWRPDDSDDKDMREAEKMACINNNIGMGNTFVWASRYSNTSDYSMMVEDLENPDNNTCFVRVALRSDDPRVNISDVPDKYFEFGNTIVCGSWVDEGMIEKRILDAKKSGRTWATIGGAVGGAGIGVGAMELFGNRIIGGKVMGQKALNEQELLRSQLAVLKQDDPATHKAFINNLWDLKCACQGLSQGEHSYSATQCAEYKPFFDMATQECPQNKEISS